MSTNFNFAGKVFVVTGGASGIGLATAEFLASHGAKVSVADIRKVPAEAVAAATASPLSGEILSSIVNVSDYAQVSLWIDSTVEKFGKLDGAVNLAGIIPRGIHVERIEEMDLEEWSRVINVNLTGVLYCMKAEIPLLNIGGSIVNASSVAGLVGFAKNASYVASKHAVIGITRSAAKEVGDRNIRVNCIAPGIIDTPMHQKATIARGSEIILNQPLQRKGQATEVASLIAWLLCDESTFITGSVQTIDGGWVC